MENAQRLSLGELNRNRSTAQANGVGEIPLNGKGAPQTGNAVGEEIVYSYMKI
jgi:hypothetical protein